jgi:dihydroflavonol-4-reductase
MKRIFVTGITGLLGANLLNDLLAKGFIVKGLIRTGSTFHGMYHENLELVRGELFDDLAPLLNGIDAVIHIAAETRQNLFNYSAYQKINCNATIQLFNASVLCKVKRFVYVSSTNTIGHGSADEPGTEEENPAYPFDNSFYAKSKLEAENYVLQNKSKTDVIVVNPGFMLGGLDSKPSSGKLVLMGWQKKIIFYPPGGKSFVHVKDVSAGIIASLEKGRAGERYLLVNENLSYHHFFKKLNSITGQDPLMIKIPLPLLRLLGRFGDLLRSFRINTCLGTTNMKIVCIDAFYSNQRSAAELDLKYRSIDEAIADAIDYFKEQEIKTARSFNQ